MAGHARRAHRDVGRPREVREQYFERFQARGYFYCGDYAVKDNDGYIWVAGRADEVLKVAGHRIGTFELESSIVSHKAASEAAVVAIPDAIKGEVPIAFVVLKQGFVPERRVEEGDSPLGEEQLQPDRRAFAGLFREQATQDPGAGR